MVKFALADQCTQDGASIYADGKSAQALIAGVELVESRAVVTANGQLTELFRRDWVVPGGVNSSEVDQVFLRTLRVGEASGWHVHAKTTDRLTTISGVLHVALYDDRPDSPTYQRVNSFFLGAARPMLLIIPPGVWHAIRAHAGLDASLINLVDIAYDYHQPDHYRLPIDTPLIPYSI